MLLVEYRLNIDAVCCNIPLEFAGKTECSVNIFGYLSINL